MAQVGLSTRKDGIPDRLVIVHLEEALPALRGETGTQIFADDH